MNYIEIWEKVGPQGLIVFLISVFTVWLFKSFYDKQYERNNREDNFNREGLAILSEALYTCRVMHNSQSLAVEKALPLYKAISYMPVHKHKKYITALNSMEYSAIEDILISIMYTMQNNRTDKLSDGSSFLRSGSNMIQRSPIYGLASAFIALLLLYSLITGAILLSIRVPSNTVLPSILLSGLCYFIFFMLCKWIDNAIKNDNIPRKWSAAAPLIYALLIICEIIIILLGFYVLNLWLFAIVIFSLGLIGYFVNRHLNKRWPINH